MASSSASVGVETFSPWSSIRFGSFNFFATTTGELTLIVPGMPGTKGTQPTLSTRSKAKKRHLKKCVTALKWCLNRHTRTKVVEAPSSTLVAVVDRQSTFILDLLKDDSSHYSIEVNSDTEDAPERAYFMEMSPPYDNDRGDKEAPNQEEEYQQ